MKAFISYCHKDKDLLVGLHEHLASLRRQEMIIVWTDREIPAGGVIEDHIDEQMDVAELYLLLISSAFIDSQYCFEKEFGRALERQKEGKAIIVPIIARDCDWDIPVLRKFKALPDDGKPITSRHWYSQDEAFANVAAGLRTLIAGAPFSKEKPAPKRKSPPSRFIANESHVTEDQRAELRRIHEEIVDRLTAKTGKLSDEEAKEKKGKWFGIVWAQFHDEFGTREHGLQSLPREKFGEAKSWLLQYRASKDKNFKRVNPQQYRNTLTKTIYSLIGELGWTKDQLYQFAADKLEYAEAIESLNDLGNRQLETVRDRVRYEMTKRNAKSKQTKAKRTPKFSPKNRSDC